MRGDRHLLGGVFRRLYLDAECGAGVSEAWKSMRQVCAVCDIWAYQPLVNHVCAQPKSSGPREWKLQASRRLETSLEDGSILHENYKETIVGPKLLPNIYDKYTEVHVLEATPATLAAGEMPRVLEDLIRLAWGAMLAANRDGAEYDTEAELKDARELLARIAPSEGGG